MAKNKHQKLAAMMNSMLNSIDRHHEKVTKSLCLIQFHFYEKLFIKDRPLMSKKVFRKMVQTHYVGLRHLAPLLQTRELCVTLPAIGMIINQRLISQSQILNRQTVGWFVPWGVDMIYPENNQDKLRQKRLESLLYCPSDNERSLEIDWYEKEDAAGSFSNLLLGIGEYYQENERVKMNLIKDPCPIYEQALEDWGSNPDHTGGNDSIAPNAGDSIVKAYETVMKSIGCCGSKHYYDLILCYKEKLETNIFEGLTWSNERKNGFINQWKDNLFEKQPKIASKNKGRWQQGYGIDRYTAAAFVEYFVLKFVQNPSQKKLGEIACILWIMLRHSFEYESEEMTVEDVIGLSTIDVDPNKTEIRVGKCCMEVSEGLHSFLYCLLGEGSGERSHKLFKNVNIKSLQRTLSAVSKVVLGEDAIPVLSSAFLIRPHLQQNARISAYERRCQLNALQSSAPDSYRRDILRALKRTGTS